MEAPEGGQHVGALGGHGDSLGQDLLQPGQRGLGAQRLSRIVLPLALPDVRPQRLHLQDLSLDTSNHDDDKVAASRLREILKRLS